MKASTITIEYVATERLVGYVRNPRRNDGVVDRMMASIREYGFTIPILAERDGTIVDGHLRLKAAKKLDLAEVPVVFCEGWTEAQVKAFRLLANRSANWADLEIADLTALGVDLNLTGFDPQEIAAMQTVIGPGLTDEDSVPEVPAEAVSKRGDLWRLGAHRLLCGDATVAADVARLLEGATPALLLSDPPYGVNYDPGWRNRAAKAGKIAFAARREGKIPNDDRRDWSDAYRLFPGNVAYVWYASLFAGEVQQSLAVCGFEAKSQIIWAKSHFAISRSHYHWQHEACLYLIRKGAHAQWKGDRRQTTLWHIETKSNEESKNHHSTPKPVECMRRPILHHLDCGQSVYDPFLGSGTTIIAAETTGRVALTMEIDPVYVDVAVKRWQDFTGRQAVLDGTKQTFNQLADRGGRCGKR
jgi:DNA modification methylase